MSIKDKLKVLPQDKANHFFYGSFAAAIGAAVFACAALAMKAPMFVALSSAVIAALVCAAGIGKLGEQLDARANAAAEAAGQPAPHTVSDADIAWTALGAIPVALPLAVLALAVKYLA